jgi:hypothetical protein
LRKFTLDDIRLWVNSGEPGMIEPSLGRPIGENVQSIENLATPGLQRSAKTKSCSRLLAEVMIPDR